MATTRGALARLMRPGLNETFGEAYEQFPAEWSGLYEHNVSKWNYEEDQQIITLGLAQIKSEGGSVTYDDFKQGYPSRYQHTAYGLGFIVTKEQVDDNLYFDIAQMKTKGLAYSMASTKNIVGANIFNYAFDSTYHPGGDGVSLINTSHPTESGVMSNVLAVSADLGESALEDILIQVADARDARNKRMALRETMLVIPKELQFEAERILKNPQRPVTAERDINAMYSQGRFPGGIHINHFFTNTKACFILTNCPNSLRYFERTAMSFTDDNDFDTENLKFKVYERYSFGWSDWRGVYSLGSP